MRAKNIKKLRKLLILILVMIMAAMPYTLLAEPTGETYENESTGIQAMTTLIESFLLQFDPQPGEFPYPETTPDDTGMAGVRFADAGELFDDFPPRPNLPGQVFQGWMLSTTGEIIDETPFVVTDHLVLIAQWTPYSEGETSGDGTAATPSPSPTPAPGQSPSPTPYAPRPGNPQTSPMSISLAIFAAVITLGLSVFAIIKLMARHAHETGQYRTKATRYQREARLSDYLKNE